MPRIELIGSGRPHMMRGVRVLIWVATIGAVVSMFWPLVSQLLATMREVDPGFY